MLPTLVSLLALSLTPGQAGLTLTDVRLTYGPLGPTRAEAKVLPGDNLFVTFAIDGITADANGKILYSISTELTDSKDKVVHRQQPQDLEALNALGGNSLPAFAAIDIGLEQPAGGYTLKVTVTDRATKKSQTLTQKFEVLPRAFGLVRLMTSAEPDGMAPIAVYGVGQSVWVNAVVVGFDRSAAKQPNLLLELRVLDEKGKPTLAKPFSGTVEKDVPASATGVPVQFLVTLNRAGKFTVELKATDQVSKKSHTQSFPLNVLSGK